MPKNHLVHLPRLAALLVAALLLGACAGGHKPADGGLVLADFPTVQQSTDYTCGCASALMVMRYYGLADETEESLAVKMHTHVAGDSTGAQPGSAVRLTDFGTSVEEMWRYLAARGDLRIVASSYCPDSLPQPLLRDTALVGIQAVGNADRRFADYGAAARFFRSHLEAGRPILVCWNFWGGHWTVCMGYDDRGTADFFDDDILVMADPYDSTDGAADGTTRVGLVQFFYDWFCVMSPKPWQLQPYIVVDRN